jgi:hypothetical protein
MPARVDSAVETKDSSEADADIKMRIVLKRGRSKIFLGDLSNSGPAVRLYSEGRAPALPKTVAAEGQIMTPRGQETCHFSAI